MLLVDRGQVSLDDPVSLYLPEFQVGERDKILVRYLLSHISGMPDMLPENTELRRAHAPLSEFVRRAIQTPLLYSPNTDFSYQSKGILLASEIVERVTGKRLRDFEEEEIFQPLGMTNTALGLGRFKIPGQCGAEPLWRKPKTSSVLDRTVPIGAIWAIRGVGYIAQDQDLGILLQAMLNGGGYAGRRVFSQAAVRAMTTNQNGKLNAPGD